MGHAIHRLEAEPEHTVEIVVHISEILEEQQRKNMIAALEIDDRIFSVELSPSRCHLMHIKYDRDQYSTADVFACITGQNMCARLIGPVWL
jgi:hypothetical protein